ncbi:hypothetical protein PCCS19_07770 [Paenibacillus sp. CCS19]|nr:hypothetical protein PCCS19_07770 [Paenibacillus cellulosilyticus]
MFEHITHYYDGVPLRSLSALSKADALKMMESRCDDTPFFERFKQPLQYWEDRMETERWLRETFAAKGGKPKTSYPIYAVLGKAEWIENYVASERFEFDLLRLPVSIFEEEDISFTFPDSMVSYFIAKNRPEYYVPHLHGHVFTLSEVQTLITPDLVNRIASMHPEGTIPYVEAQIWNHEAAMRYYEGTVK